VTRDTINRPQLLACRLFYPMNTYNCLVTVYCVSRMTNIYLACTCF
jgi:hypothetical protein